MCDVAMVLSPSSCFFVGLPPGGWQHGDGKTQQRDCHIPGASESYHQTACLEKPGPDSLQLVINIYFPSVRLLNREHFCAIVPGKKSIYLTSFSPPRKNINLECATGKIVPGLLTPAMFAQQLPLVMREINTFYPFTPSPMAKPCFLC